MSNWETYVGEIR